MTMIERIARALCRLDDNPENATMDGKPLWQDYLPQARAVFQELQNPTDAMADAGAKSAYDCVIDMDAHGARTIFAAMIDAALVDGA